MYDGGVSSRQSPGTGRTDEALLLAYAAGDADAFVEFYERTSGKVYAFLKSRLKSAEQADDLLQAVYLKLHQNREKYDPKFAAGQWIFVIARTTLLDHLRKQSRQVAVSDSFEEALNGAADELSQKGGEPAYPEVWEDLPPEQRQAIEMRVMNELSYEQIARTLNRSEASVRQLVSRGLRRLREVF